MSTPDEKNLDKPALLQKRERLRAALAEAEAALPAHSVRPSQMQRVIGLEEELAELELLLGQAP